MLYERSDESSKLSRYSNEAILDLLIVDVPNDDCIVKLLSSESVIVPSIVAPPIVSILTFLALLAELS